MNKKQVNCLLGAAVGTMAGVILGCFIGLIIGGTFLGGFDIHESIGMEGYELTFYIGGLIGGIVGAILGFKNMKEKCD